MADLPPGNAAIGQSGGPTAVINQSLAGVIQGLRQGLCASGHVKSIFGMRHGVRGIVKDDGGLVDLTAIAQDRLEAIAATPSAALGSTRDKPDEAYCQRILDGCRKHDIRYFFYIGGNDSMDTADKVNRLAAVAGYELRVLGVPKTIANDLVVFGDKAALFERAVDTYARGAHEAIISAFTSAGDLSEAGRNVLLTGADVYSKPDGVSTGCLLVGTALPACAVLDAPRATLTGFIAGLEDALEQSIVTHYAKDAQRTRKSPRALALLLTSLVFSLAVRARMGLSRRKLRAIAVELSELFG